MINLIFFLFSFSNKDIPNLKKKTTNNLVKLLYYIEL